MRAFFLVREGEPVTTSRQVISETLDAPPLNPLPSTTMVRMQRSCRTALIPSSESLKLWEWCCDQVEGRELEMVAGAAAAPSYREWFKLDEAWSRASAGRRVALPAPKRSSVDQLTFAG